MSDVEQVSGENEIEIATGGVTKTCVTPVKQHPLHHHHHHHHHHLKQQQQQQQQSHQQQHPQYRPQTQQQQHPQQQRLSSTLTIEEGVVDSTDLIETRHSPGHAGLLSRVLKVLFSTPGLVVLVVVYSVMGALIFPMLEAPQDIRKNVAIAKSREDCLKELWIITEKLNVLYERNWTMLVHEQLRRFEGSIVAATRNGGGGGSSNVGNTAALTGFETDKGRWSFSEALLYSVTVITTIGHGNLTPKSSAGKIATILYALIGVPLMLMCLSSLGGLLAEALQCTYTRICCRLQRVQRQQQQQHHHHRKPTHESGVGSAAVGECESGGVGTTREAGGDDGGGGTTRRKSIDSTGSSSCHGQSHEMDCKSCKYDAVMGETSLHNGFKFGSLTEREDSCQLLHASSPNKMHHNSPCIQLKSQPVPPPNLKQYHHHHLAMAQHQHQQQQQHQQMSPQHQTYQMSPSNPATNTINTYHQQQVMVPNNVHAQQHYHHQQQHQQQQQQQHLVQQNGCTEITGTATIYFPIATATPGNPLNLPASAAAVHYNHQPLVKYHTIQLQHKKAMPMPMPMTMAMAMPTSAPLTTATAVSGATIFEQQLPGHTVTVGTGMTTLTLPPPPPHYQTATVHGIRRAKFLAKPMPQEINTLLAESDISCRHDVPGGSPVNQPRAGGSSESGNSSSTPGSVDIMEDEEENEQNRMGSCPHGTPSRVPLISSSTGGRKNPSNDSKTLDSRKLPPSGPGSGSGSTLGAGQRRRVRLMTTNNSKSGHKRNCCLDSACNLHTDHTEDEDDDDDDEEDEDDGEDNYGEDNDGAPQVPITIVLLILVAYICLGTVIFAFWENWSLIDGAYFCFVTLSTIGYADFMPQHTFQGPDVQLFACCAYLLLGLVLVAMSFSILETQLMWKCKRIAVRLKLARD